MFVFSGVDSLSKGRQEANFAPGEFKIIMIIMFYQLGDSFWQNLFSYNDQYSATVWERKLTGGAGIDLEQKVVYTGHVEDHGKVVSFETWN